MYLLLVDSRTKNRIRPPILSIYFCICFILISVFDYLSNSLATKKVSDYIPANTINFNKYNIDHYLMPDPVSVSLSDYSHHKLKDSYKIYAGSRTNKNGLHEYNFFYQNNYYTDVEEIHNKNENENHDSEYRPNFFKPFRPKCYAINEEKFKPFQRGIIGYPIPIPLLIDPQVENKTIKEQIQIPFDFEKANITSSGIPYNKFFNYAFRRKEKKYKIKKEIYIPPFDGDPNSYGSFLTIENSLYQSHSIAIKEFNSHFHEGFIYMENNMGFPITLDLVGIFLNSLAIKEEETPMVIKTIPLHHLYIDSNFYTINLCADQNNNVFQWFIEEHESDSSLLLQRQDEVIPPYNRSVISNYHSTINSLFFDLSDNLVEYIIGTINSEINRPPNQSNYCYNIYDDTLDVLLSFTNYYRNYSITYPEISNNSNQLNKYKITIIVLLIGVGVLLILYSYQSYIINHHLKRHNPAIAEKYMLEIRTLLSRNGFDIVFQGDNNTAYIGNKIENFSNRSINREYEVLEKIEKNIADLRDQIDELTNRLNNE